MIECCSRSFDRFDSCCFVFGSPHWARWGIWYLPSPDLAPPGCKKFSVRPLVLDGSILPGPGDPPLRPNVKYFVQVSRKHSVFIPLSLPDSTPPFCYWFKTAEAGAWNWLHRVQGFVLFETRQGLGPWRTSRPLFLMQEFPPPAKQTS